jgi:hypothetical protein
MYKVFLTVRNRLSITIKCITALVRHSEMPFQLYIYDNISHTMLRERFLYYSLLYEKKIATQITINTEASTFNAFSKAASCNQFGYLHEDDPKKDQYSFLLFLDNDMIVTPKFDKILEQAWQEVSKDPLLQSVRVITYLGNATKAIEEVPHKIAGYRAFLGKLSGSSFWCVKPDFFRQVGFLDLRPLTGRSKGHDQYYWPLLDRSSKGKSYILALQANLAIHTGKYVGSVCNALRTAKDIKRIEFREAEREIDKLSFDEFYRKITTGS